MTTPPPDPTEQLRAEILRLRAHVAHLEARAAPLAPDTSTVPSAPAIWFDSVNDAIFIVDSTWAIQQWNQAATQLYGWSAAEAVGRHITDLIAVARYLDGGGDSQAREILRSSGSWRGTMLQQTRDGREVMVESAIRALTDGEGAVTGYIGVNRDVTARLRAEQALRDSETRFRTLFETMTLGVIVYDITGRAIVANPAAERIIGLARADVIGNFVANPGWSVTYEDGTPITKETHPVLIALQTGQEMRDLVLGLTPPAGAPTTWLRVQVVPWRHADASETAQVYAVFEDITEQRAVRLTLEHERQQLAGILNTMHEGVIAARPDGTLALVNPAAMAMRDLDPAHPPAVLVEMVEQAPQRAFDAQGQALLPDDWPMRRALRGERFAGLELNLRSTRGEPERWQLFNGAPIYDEHGALMLGIVTARDITQRKRDEATLRQQAAMLDHAHILICDAESRIIAWNQGAERLYGWTPEEAIGRISHELFQTRFPTSLGQVHEVLFAAGRWEGELVHHRRDGHELVVASLKVLFRDEVGRPTRILEVNNDVTALKRAEEDLREREARLRQAYEVAQLGTWYVDVASGSATLDARARAQFGVTDETLTFAALAACVHPEDLVRLEHEAQELRGSGAPGHTQTEFRVIHPDGSIHWLASHARYIVEGEGMSHAVVGAFRVTQEITTRKQYEAALQEAYAQAEAQAARLESLLAYAPVGISLLDPELRFQHINEQLAAINGLPPEAHLGRRIQEVLPALAPVLEEFYHQVLATGAALLDVEIAGETPAAPGVTRIWQASYFPVRVAQGPLIGVGVVLIDTTARRQAERARDEAHRQLEAIVEALDEGVIAMQPDGTLVAINRAAREAILADPAARPSTVHELAAMSAMAVYDTTGQPLAADALPFMRVFRGESFRNLELKFRPARAEEQRWVLVSGTMIPAAGGAGSLGIVTRNDITERKRAELELAAHAETLSRTNAELTRALRLKDEFLAMMSHELRTPLNAVLGLAEGMQEEFYGPMVERQQRAMERLVQSGQHLLSLLSDMLDLARISAGGTQLSVDRISVEQLCQTVLQLISGRAEKKGIQLLRTSAYGLEGLRADERRLTQILTNLLDNAVKFTPAGGTVGLEVRGERDQEQIAFTVWDTGIGIAAEDMGRLFKPFTQVDGRLARAYEGIGLGLTLVKRLTELHGGSVELVSTPGVGSRFTVTLPWRQADNVAPAAAPPQSAAPASWAAPPHVLVADDHEPTLEIYAEQLALRGCRVTVARTGVEALEQIRRVRPDVVVLDVQMPELDGLSVIRAVRAEPAIARMPIIAVSALAMSGDIERGLAAGATRYLVKPVGIRALLQQIVAVLDEQPPEQL